MKNTINTIFSGFGYTFLAIGFVFFIAAAGHADLDSTIPEIVRYLKAGLELCAGGLFLTRWRI